MLLLLCFNLCSPVSLSFAANPEYQIGGRYVHCRTGDGTGPWELLLCRVLLGASQQLGDSISAETRRLTEPDERAHDHLPDIGNSVTGGRLHDSVTAGPHRPARAGGGANESEVHVVYKTEQVYPAYIVTFQQKPEAAAALGSRVAKAPPRPPASAASIGIGGDAGYVHCFCCARALLPAFGVLLCAVLPSLMWGVLSCIVDANISRLALQVNSLS